MSLRHTFRSHDIDSKLLIVDDTCKRGAMIQIVYPLPGCALLALALDAYTARNAWR